MHPIYSPDGTKIAFSKRSGGYDHIWMLAANSSTQTQITYGRVLDKPKSFSRDGSQLFFERISWKNRALLPDTQIFSVNWTDLKADLESIGQVYSLSQNQQQLVFNIFNETTLKPEIWCSNQVSGRHAYMGSWYSPAISPDGSVLVCLPTDFRHDTLILIDIASSSNRVVSVPFGPKTQPEFGFGGSNVVFRILPSEKGGRGRIYLLNVNNGTYLQIADSD